MSVQCLARAWWAQPTRDSYVKFRKRDWSTWVWVTLGARVGETQEWSLKRIKERKEDFLWEVRLERGVHKTPSGHRKALVDWSQKEGKRQAWGESG